MVELRGTNYPNLLGTGALVMAKIVLQNGEGPQLEALYEEHSGQLGVIITHPHPLYGGDMTNPVVESLAMVYGRRGFSTLRFNFRGVRGSEGRYDEGIGEQDDVMKAIRYLIGNGCTIIHLAGYSFGSWVISRLTSLPPEVRSLVFISPPVAFVPFAESLTLPLLDLVITGDEDEFAPPAMVGERVQKWNPECRYEILDNTDHFYFGSFSGLENLLAVWLQHKRGD